MTQHNDAYKRKKYFIKRGFQFGFILKFCILLLIGVVISTGLLFFFSQGTLTSSFQHSRLVIMNTGMAILPAAIYTNLITLGLITLATIIVTLIVSHKIAGPMFRFEKELKEISEGNLAKHVTLREEDQMTEMAESLNQMVSSLHGKVSGIRFDIENLVQSANEQDVPKKVIEQLNKLRENMENSFKM